MRRTGLWAMVAVGCRFDSVEDACPDHVPGQSHGTDAAVDVIGRIGCYRRYVGLDRADIDGRITDAVVAHASYLAQNGTIGQYGSWQAETPGLAGFTGADAFERLYASEYLVEDVGSAFVWEVLLAIDDATDRGALVDEVIDDPFIRDVFLAPAWEGAGYAEGTDPVIGTFAYMNIVLYFPSGARSGRPVVYPRDGQVDVPTSFALFDPGDPALAGLPPVVGYPLTFTMGSSTLGSGSVNPLEVQVLESTILGPSGPVEHAVLLPTSYLSGVNWSTAILIPRAPLDPSTTYDVDARFSWIDRDNRHETLSFTTAATAPTTAVARAAGSARVLAPR